MLNRILIAAGLSAFSMLTLSVILTPARADQVRSHSCVGSFGAFSCVTSWHTAKDPHTRRVTKKDAQEVDESQQRDRLWIARCRPVVHQDEFGVLRYRYAAPGCEFGKYE